MLRNKKKKSLFVHAVRNNRDGSTTKKIFGRVAWDSLAPIVQYDPMGGKKEFPKQGFEEVPEGWGEKAPAPLKSTAKAKTTPAVTRAAKRESTEKTEDSE